MNNISYNISNSKNRDMQKIASEAVVKTLTSKDKDDIF